MDQHFYRISCKALIYDETRTKVLLFKENNGMYEFPGWGLDFGESPHTTIRREIKEESWLETTRIADHPCYFIAGEKDDKLRRIGNIFYETKIQNLDFTISDECQELGFFTKEEALQLDSYSTVKMMLEQLP